MKVIMQPIEMIAWFKIEGTPRPVRCRLIKEDETAQVIKIDHILSIERERRAGNPMIVYTCQSLIGNEQRVYELKYEIASCTWYLSKA